MSDLVTIARGDASRIVEPRRMIVRTGEEWRALWALHAGPESPAPAVDFTTRLVAAAFAGEAPSAGYTLEITGIRQYDNVQWLQIEEGRPGPDSVAAQILTSPFHIVSLPRTDRDVRWFESQISPRPLTSSYGETKSSTGLAPRTASALAYLAGPFSGFLILLAESANADVRFHAWQSIIALGGLGVAVVLGYLIAVASLFISATAVSFIVRISTVIWLGLIVTWAICLWKAYGGGRWKLPLAGDMAERISNRVIE